MHLLPILLFSLATLIGNIEAQKRLAVRGNKFYINNHRVFLSGMNIAWYSYGNDFGNNQYLKLSREPYEKWVKDIAANGGNSIRFWIHGQGRHTPAWDQYGNAVDTDSQKTMVYELTQLLNFAQKHDVLVFPVLWDGAREPSLRLKNIIKNKDKRQKYIDNVLTPLVGALAGARALGGWEIMNEPEGILDTLRGSKNPCFDGLTLDRTGAGWVGRHVSMKEILQFVNHLASAIKTADPYSLVTLGSWHQRAQNDVFKGHHNYYKDSCVIQGNNDDLGHIDFHQMHTYKIRMTGKYDASSPMRVINEKYSLNKPNVIGEFSKAGGPRNETIETLFNWAVDKNFDGAWSWCANGPKWRHSKDADTFYRQARGLRSIRHKIPKINLRR